VTIQRQSRRFVLTLLLVGVLALVVRVAYVLIVKRHDELIADEKYYYYQSRWLAEGWGFVVAPGSHVPSALHPPLPSILIAPAIWISSGMGILAARLWCAFVGAIAVVVVGFAGREVMSERVGIVAALLAAVYPGIWMNDGIVMAEPFAVLGTALLILMVYRFLRRPTWGGAFLMGLLLGLTMLTRGELMLLVFFLVIPAVIAKRAAGWRTTAVRLVVAGCGALLVVGPWVAWNLTRFEEPLYISANLGGVICGANNPTAYYGDEAGMWILNGCPLPKRAPDQSVLDHYFQDRGVQYMEDHTGRLPVVMVKRVLRTWEVYKPSQMVEFLWTEGRPRGLSWASLVCLAVLSPFVVLGGVVLWRRRRTMWPLVSMLAFVTFSGAIFGGNPRYRVTGEVAIVLLAAVSIEALASREWPGRRSSTSGDDDGTPPAIEPPSDRDPELVGS
jgi:4-amino-4-deoxy-L-arabinose transferase-like glycosyltransferase